LIFTLLKSPVDRKLKTLPGETVVHKFDKVLTHVVAIDLENYEQQGKLKLNNDI
jgi:hypothetical protein